MYEVFFSLPDIKGFLDSFSKEVSIFFFRPSLTHLLSRFSLCFETNETFVLVSLLT